MGADVDVDVGTVVADAGNIGETLLVRSFGVPSPGVPDLLSQHHIR